MLEVKDGRWFERLDDSPKVKWMRRVYPRVDYTQAPWTVVLPRLGSRAKAPTLDTNGFGAQIRLHQRYKTANAFRTRSNYYYMWPKTLLELKYSTLLPLPRMRRLSPRLWSS